MIKQNQKKFNRLHILLDALVIILAYMLSWFIIFGDGKHYSKLSLGIYVTALLFILPVYIVFNAIFGLYASKRIRGRLREFSGIVKTNTLGVLIITMFLYFGSKNIYLYHFSRRMVFIFYLLNIVALTIERNCLRAFLNNIRAKGYNQKHVILIGYSRAAEGYIDRVISNHELGYRIRGILDDKYERGHEYKGIKVIGTIDNLEEILKMNLLDEIAITLGLSEYYMLEDIVYNCEKFGVHTKFIPDYNNIIPTIPSTEDFMGLPVINIRNVPLTILHNFMLKRLVDIIGALVGIIIFSPVMLIIALIIKLTSRGPIIFSQERIGLHSRPFKMYKFRSMEVQNESSEKSKWTKKNDPRVTNIGKFIRKTSLDEIPQFFNILMGDMSLVGPRPERPFYVEKFRDEIKRYMVKHQVRPGLTGWAQINGYRGDTSIQARIDHDLYYIENWSLGFDFKIMFLTIFKGFINKNAY